MIDTIYIEQEVENHTRVKEILSRFSHCDVVLCDHYGELFNRKSQNFRIQKRAPKLILSTKKNKKVLEAPAAYNIGGKNNYYFSHMMNCIYDCRYCFLQGMYRSANYVLFVNYEEFEQEILSTLKNHHGEDVYFFSGYDCDSLALEPVSKFMEFVVPVFRGLSNAYLELRTKSTQIRYLLDAEPLENIIVAYSLSPINVVSALEDKTPSLEKRISALEKLQNHGWTVGLRFDPVIYHKNFVNTYGEMFKQVFGRLNVNQIHSVSLGGFRLPLGFYNNIQKLYPESKLFSTSLQTKNDMVAFEEKKENEVLRFCEKEILSNVSQDKYFPCF